ncbi:MAG: FeoA domain-containing protein [Chloroflexi bacterium]|nr:FeoA domain-containing protein [Chloroflexota bacterium]
MPVITLDKLVPGESGKITKIRGKGAIRRRLVDMGMTSGAVIDMVKISPLGDPVEYRLRGYHLSLRKSEAQTIEVELIGKPIPLRGRGNISESAVPLGRCKSGQVVEITRTRGGKRFHGKLKELGLNPGSKIRVVQNDFPDPLIISLNDENRLVIGKGMAMHILVKPA